MRNLTLLLTGTTQDKSKVKISQNFVAFSEYMNFISRGSLRMDVTELSLLRKYSSRFLHPNHLLKLLSVEISKIPFWRAN